MKKIIAKREAIILLLIGIYYLIWAYLLKYNNNPDEQMRYLIPQYIYYHGALPSGYAKEAMLSYGNWSYAFYPQLLGGIVSAICMKIMSFFSDNFASLVFAARWTSVICGVIAVAFVGKSTVAISKSRNLGLVAMLFIAFLPQFTYLSAYVNNDVIAVAGISVIIYSLINASQKRFNYKNSLGLAVGIIICLLGYMNSFPFVLVAVVYAVALLIYQIKKQLIPLKNGLKILLCAIIITIICVAPFYIRNWLMYKDILGTHIFHKRYVEWLQNGGEVLQHPYKAGYKDLLLNSGWIIETFKSFIGVFGYLSIYLKSGWYIAYLLLMYSGLLGYLMYCKQKEDMLLNIFSLVILIASLITCALSIYYSVNTDYQSQGRYVMGILPFLAICFGIGIKEIACKLCGKYRILISAIMVVYVGVNILFAIKYVFPVIG